MIKLTRKKPQPAGPSAAHIRVQKDLSEAVVPSTMSLHFPEPNDMMNFNLTIVPDEGYYTGGSFHFVFRIPPNYPHEPPKVICTNRVYHPNIDLQGNICLNILREDWKPVLNLNSVFVGLQFILLEPNADDPLNKDAAEVLRADCNSFAINVNKSMKGGSINGNSFDKIK